VKTLAATVVTFATVFLSSVVVALFGLHVFAATHPACSGQESKLEYFSQQSAPSVSEFENDWFSKHLLAMREPSLNCATDWPVYRFLWLRTFHHPIVVRVEFKPNETRLIAVELDGAGGYEPGKQRRRIDRALSLEESAKLLDAIAHSRVWDAADEPEVLGLDGSQWVVEARGGERYRVRNAWTPEKGSAFDLGKALLASTGWKIPERDFY
jgi:hypothetical protein